MPDLDQEHKTSARQTVSSCSKSLRPCQQEPALLQARRCENLGGLRYPQPRGELQASQEHSQSQLQVLLLQGMVVRQGLCPDSRSVCGKTGTREHAFPMLVCCAVPGTPTMIQSPTPSCAEQHEPPPGALTCVPLECLGNAVPRVIPSPELAPHAGTRCSCKIISHHPFLVKSSMVVGREGPA